MEPSSGFFSGSFDRFSTAELPATISRTQIQFLTGFGSIESAMRAVVQRVSQAQVTVANEVTGQIERGLLVLLGVAVGDTDQDAQQMAQKIVDLRIFEDEAGKMNRSLLEANGALLVVSQFTLLGDCRKGRRPSFIKAAPPEEAERLYQVFVEAAKKSGHRSRREDFERTWMYH